jgi:hypothetical protein
MDFGDAAAGTAAVAGPKVAGESAVPASVGLSRVNSDAVVNELPACPDTKIPI